MHGKEESLKSLSRLWRMLHMEMLSLFEILGLPFQCIRKIGKIRKNGIFTEVRQFWTMGSVFKISPYQSGILQLRGKYFSSCV